MSLDLLRQTGLSLDRLQSFCLVAEAGGVTKAAKGDATRQSLYSRQVKELEEFFGVELMRRMGRGIALTAAGTRLHTIAREHFASLSDFKRDCADLPAEIVIGAGDSLIQWLLLPRLRELRQSIPNARFRFLNLTTETAVRQLADGLIDFAVVRRDAISPPLRATPLGSLRFSLFVPKTLAEALPAAPTPAQVFGLPLATLEGQGSFRSELAALAERRGTVLNIQVECSSFPLVARAVARGDVAALLPSIAAADLRPDTTTEFRLPLLKKFDRPLALATNPRLLRIRPILSRAATQLACLARLEPT
jgi:DNA-binding transcriptional LysR family regulator